MTVTKNFEFTFSPILVEKIADRAIQSPTGARSVREYLHDILSPAKWEVYVFQDVGGECIVNDDSSIEIAFLTRDSIIIPALKEYDYNWDEEWLETLN